jgi:hypothetical protein
MTEAGTKPDRAPERDAPPPFLGTWPRAYAAVIGWLALLIVLFYLIGRRFTS